MDEVDEDGSGQIEFNEFLHIIKSAQHEKSKRAKRLQKLERMEEPQTVIRRNQQ